MTDWSHIRSWFLNLWSIETFHSVLLVLLIYIHLIYKYPFQPVPHPKSPKLYSSSFCKVISSDQYNRQDLRDTDKKKMQWIMNKRQKIYRLYTHDRNLLVFFFAVFVPHFYRSEGSRELCKRTKITFCVMLVFYFYFFDVHTDMSC